MYSTGAKCECLLPRVCVGGCVFIHACVLPCLHMCTCVMVCVCAELPSIGAGCCDVLIPG